MGLQTEEESSRTNEVLNKVMQLVLDIRAKVKANKDFATSDEIRNKLTEAGIQVKDGKEGATWSIG
jgi:cysteinyl-tRNA synthetase